MSQQDSRSAGQRVGALYKVDTSFITLSHTIVYILPSYRKLLNSGVGDDAPASAANNNNSSHNNAVASSEKKKMPRFDFLKFSIGFQCIQNIYRRFTKSDHEALVDIFKKIGQKELTKVGICLFV